MSLKEANDLIETARYAAAQAVKTSSLIEWGTVVNKTIGADGGFWFDVAPASDPSVIIKNISNQGDYDLYIGDLVALFLVNGDLYNCYIVGKRKATSAETSVAASQKPKTVSSAVFSGSGITPEVIFSVQSNGEATFVKVGERIVAYVEVNVGSSPFTAWWDVGQPFDGYVYSAPLSVAAQQCAIISKYHHTTATNASSEQRTLKYWWGKTATRVSLLASSFLVQCHPRTGKDPRLCAPTLPKAWLRVRVKQRTINGTNIATGGDVSVDASLQVLDVLVSAPETLRAPSLSIETGSTILNITTPDWRADQFVIKEGSNNVLGTIGRNVIDEITEFDLSQMRWPQDTTHSICAVAQSSSGIFTDSSPSNYLTYVVPTPPIKPTLAAPTIALRDIVYLAITDQDGNAQKFVVSARPPRASFPVNTTEVSKTGEITEYDLATWVSLPLGTTWMVKAKAVADGYNSSEYSGEVPYDPSK